jgi:hypothetical protein
LGTFSVFLGPSWVLELFFSVEKIHQVPMSLSLVKAGSEFRSLLYFGKVRFHFAKLSFFGYV